MPTAFSDIQSLRYHSASHHAVAPIRSRLQAPSNTGFTRLGRESHESGPPRCRTSWASWASCTSCPEGCTTRARRVLRPERSRVMTPPRRAVCSRRVLPYTSHPTIAAQLTACTAGRADTTQTYLPTNCAINWAPLRSSALHLYPAIRPSGHHSVSCPSTFSRFSTFTRSSARFVTRHSHCSLGDKARQR